MKNKNISFLFRIAKIPNTAIHYPKCDETWYGMKERGWNGGTLADSREIIGLIFPENFIFSENKIRTARVNKIINFIYLVNN